MSRSQWKGNFIDKSLYKNFSKKKTEDNSKKNLEFQKSDKIPSIPKATGIPNALLTSKKNTKAGNKNNKKVDKNEILIKINSRRSTILKPFIGKEVWIYNGQIYIKRKITETMVGHKFGEFAYTRKRYIYKKKIQWHVVAGKDKK